MGSVAISAVHVAIAEQPNVFQIGMGFAGASEAVMAPLWRLGRLRTRAGAVPGK